METDQKINCTVTSCKFNNGKEKRCMLQSIHVAPLENVDTKMPDESKCESYKYEEQNKGW